MESARIQEQGNGMQSKTRNYTKFVDRETNSVLFTLGGGTGVRKMHLTADSHAAEWVFNVTDNSGVVFTSRCGKEIVDVVVGDATPFPQAVCRGCANKTVEVSA